MTAIALLQSAGTAAMFVQILPIVAIVAVFYFLVIAPANKQRKHLQEMLAALKKGDRVVTSGGVHGTIQGIEGETVQLRIAENVKIKVDRAAIARVVSVESTSE
jgi:preprotein translocase, YajC subunit